MRQSEKSNNRTSLKAMNDKIYVDGGIVIDTPFFKYKNAGARYDVPPEGAEILLPNSEINGEPCLEIKEEEKNGKIIVKAPSFFKEYYARTYFSTRYCFAPFFSNSISDCFVAFHKRKDEIIDLLESNEITVSTRQLLYRLSIVSLVAAIDTLISDLILYIATKDRNKFLKAIDLAVPSTSKNKILERIIQMWCDNKIDSAEQEVIDFILSKSYTDLEKIQSSIKSLYEITISKDARINEIFHLRNLIAHRNGRKKDGSILEFTVDDIFNVIKDLINFVDNLKSQISTSNILKTL